MCACLREALLAKSCPCLRDAQLLKFSHACDMMLMTPNVGKDYQGMKLSLSAMLEINIYVLLLSASGRQHKPQGLLECDGETLQVLTRASRFGNGCIEEHYEQRGCFGKLPPTYCNCSLKRFW